MNDKLLSDFYAAWNTKPIAGNYTNKVAFHKLARKVCKQIAADLGLAAGTFDVRTNMAGDGVGGETTLHADTLYLQFGTDSPGFLEVLYRTCEGRKAYNGGLNRWVRYEMVCKDYPNFLELLRNLKD